MSSESSLPRLVYSRDRQQRRWSELDDRELLAAMAESDDELAFDELVRRKTQPLLQASYRVVGDLEEARDVVQLAFLRIWNHRGSYDGRHSPNTWLYRITTNLAIDHLRSRRSRERAAEPLRHHLQLHGESRRRHAGAERLSGSEVQRIFEELSSTLTEKQRAIFVLRELEGLSSKEVGEILGCRESTVRNHLFNARKTLRSELARRYPEYAGERGEEERS